MTRSTTRSLLTAAVATLAVATVASAQTRPADDAATPRYSSPFWSERGQDRADDAETTQFPTELAAKVAPARAELAGLRADYDRLLRDLSARSDELEEAYRLSSDRREVRDDLQAARREVESLREAVLADLDEVDEYAAAANLQASLSAQARREHEAYEPNRDRIQALSEEALVYAQQRAEFEREALAGSSDFQAARDRLTSLIERANELQRDHEETLRTDGELQSLRAELSDLQPKLAAATAYADNAARAADLAIDFARDKVARENQPAYPYSYGGRYGYPSYGYGGYGGYYGYPTTYYGVTGGYVGASYASNPLLTNVVRGGVISTVADSNPPVGGASIRNQPLPEFDGPELIGPDLFPNLFPGGERGRDR